MTGRAIAPLRAVPGPAVLATMAVLAVLAVLAAAAVVQASPRSLVADGNKLFASEQYVDALSRYEEAGVDLPESAVVAYNKGNVYFRQEEFEKAREAYQDAASRSDDLSLEARAKYNLGNTAYFQGMRQLDSDLQKCLGHLQEAVIFYQEGLELDPEDGEARYNIEVVRLTIKDVLDRIKQQEEEQKKNQEAMEKIRKELERLIKEQGEEIGATRAVAERKGASHATPGQEEEDFSAVETALADDQGRIRDDTTTLTEEIVTLAEQAPEEAKGPLAQAAKETGDATLAQDRAEDHLRGGALDEAEPAEKEALEALERAREALSQGQCDQPQDQQQQQDQQQNQPQQQQDSQEQMEQEAAGASPDEILEEEEEERREREKKAAGRIAPVLKDW